MFRLTVLFLYEGKKPLTGGFSSQRTRNNYNDVIMGATASQITSLTIVYSTVYTGADQSKHQSSASLAFVWGIHRGPVNSPHKWPVTRKMFLFDDVIMFGKRCYVVTWSHLHVLTWWSQWALILFWKIELSCWTEHQRRWNILRSTRIVLNDRGFVVKVQHSIPTAKLNTAQ